MEKSIGKTILITSMYTIIFILLFIFLAISIWGLASPKTASNFCQKAGLKNPSAVLACMQYDKTEDINDLATAVERCIVAGNDVKMYKYGKKLIQHKEFDAYAEFMNKNFSDKMGDITGEYDYSDYIYTGYVTSVFNLGYEQDAYNISISQVTYNDKGYSAKNPLRKVITLATSGKNYNYLLVDINEFLMKKLEILETKGNFDSDIKNVCIDGELVASVLNDTTAMQIFIDKYDEIVEKEA